MVKRLILLSLLVLALCSVSYAGGPMGYGPGFQPTPPESHL